MQCKNCGTQWDISIHGNSIQKFCPVCGKPVSEAPASRQPATLEEALFVIRKDYGMGYLQDSTRIMAYFSDLAPHLRKEKILLQNLIQCDGNRLLIAALTQPPQEQQLCMNRLTSRLMEDLFLSETAARMICSSFWNAITLTTEPKPEPTPAPKQAPEPTPDDCYQLSCATEHTDIQTSLHLLTKAAKGGHHPSQAKLAKSYRDGIHVSKDPKKAFSWYKEAASGNDPDVLCNLGWCYATGFGCAINPVCAALSFEKAAKAGIPAGQYNHAKCFEKGFGEKQDLTRAAALYEAAAKAGHVGSQYAMGQCYQLGKGLRKDINLAIYWYKQAAQNGSANAQYTLGQCYEMGYGFDKDPDLAVYWYRKAAGSGHKDAIAKLALL